MDNYKDKIKEARQLYLASPSVVRLRNAKVFNEIIQGLKSLKREHYRCEDEYYSCPMAGDKHLGDLRGDKCDCGADEQNLEIDRIIELTEFLMAEYIVKEQSGGIA